MTSLICLVTWPGYTAIRSRVETFKMAAVEEEVESEEVTFKSLVMIINKSILAYLRFQMKPNNMMFNFLLGCCRCSV